MGSCHTLATRGVYFLFSFFVSFLLFFFFLIALADRQSRTGGEGLHRFLVSPAPFVMSRRRFIEHESPGNSFDLSPFKGELPARELKMGFRSSTRAIFSPSSGRCSTRHVRPRRRGNFHFFERSYLVVG